MQNDPSEAVTAIEALRIGPGERLLIRFPDGVYGEQFRVDFLAVLDDMGLGDRVLLLEGMSDLEFVVVEP